MVIGTIDDDYEGLEEMSRRMAFNVYADESDDHSKNFSFWLKEGGRWELAPAYDLTGGVPPEAPPDDTRRWENCHVLSINLEIRYGLSHRNPLNYALESWSHPLKRGNSSGEIL